MDSKLANKPLTGESMRAAISEALAVYEAFKITRDPREWTPERRAEFDLLAYAPPNLRDFEKQPPGGAWDFHYAFCRASLVYLEIHDNAEYARKNRMKGGA